MPSQKQINAAKLVSENISLADPLTLGEILLKAGYTKSVSKRPSQVIESDGFQELMLESGVTEEKVLKVISEGLDATKVISAKIVGKNATEQTDDFIDVPDWPSRHKFVETSLKLQGKNLGQNTPNAVTQINIGNGEEADKMRSKFTEFLEAETLD